MKLKFCILDRAQWHDLVGHLVTTVYGRVEKKRPLCIFLRFGLVKRYSNHVLGVKKYPTC